MLVGLPDEAPAEGCPDLGEDELGPAEGDLRWDFGARLPERGPLDDGPVLCLDTTVVFSVLLVTVLSTFLTTLLVFSTNSLLEVEELKTGDFSEDSGVTGTFLCTHLHDECWNLSSLAQRAAIFLLIALPQNEPVDEGPKIKKILSLI